MSAEHADMIGHGAPSELSSSISNALPVDGAVPPKASSEVPGPNQLPKSLR